jgi:hypothetical protein
MKRKIDPIAFRSAKVRKATANSKGTRRISTSINDNNIKLFVDMSDRNYLSPTLREVINGKGCFSLIIKRNESGIY